MLALEQFQIYAEVAGGGADVGVTEHDLHGAQVAAVIDKRGGEAGAKQVRVMTGPRSVPGREADTLAPARKADSASGIAVDNLPHTAGVAEGIAVVGDEQHRCLARARGMAQAQPTIEQTEHLLRERHKASVDVQQAVLLKDVADRETHEFSGTDPGFVHQPHDHMVAKADQRGEVRCGQKRADLVVAQVSRQPLWRSRGTRQHGWRVLGRVAVSQCPPVKTANRAQLKIKGRWPNSAPTRTYPRIYGGF